MKKREMTLETKGSILIGVTLLFNLLYTVGILPTNLASSVILFIILIIIHVCILIGFTMSIQLKFKEMIFFSTLALIWLIYITMYGFLLIQ